MSRSAKVFIRCAVALAIAAIVDGVLGPQSLFAQAVSPQALADARTACASDVQKLCAGVPSGGGRIIACLKQHQAEVSDGCKQAIVKAMRGSGGDASPGTVAPAAPSLPEASAPAPSTPAPQAPPSISAKHAAVAGSAASGSYLILKKAQIMVNDPDYDKTPSPAIEMLIPSTWDFKGAVHMFGGKTGCFSEGFSVFWEATSTDGVTKFQGIPNYAWQYSDDPQELHKLTDPNRRTHTGNKTNDLCPVSKPLERRAIFPPVRAERPEARDDGGIGRAVPRPRADRAPTQWTAASRRRQRRRARRRDPGTARVSKGRQADGTLVLRGARDPDLSRRSRISLRSPRRRPSRVGCAEGRARCQRQAVQGGDEFHSTPPRYTAFTNKWIASYYQTQANKEAAMDRIQADLDNFVTQTYLHMSANAQRVSDIGFHATDQNLRDVQTYRDPSTGRTFELSNQYGHAWLNGANQYVMSDDPNFNPNSALSGSWNELQPVQP